MSKSIETTPKEPFNPTPTVLLEDVFFAPLLQALQTPGITRGCSVVNDASFACMAALRVLENSKSRNSTNARPGAPAIKASASKPSP
jgi:hypothetical protein